MPAAACARIDPTSLAESLSSSPGIITGWLDFEPSVLCITSVDVSIWIVVVLA